MNYTRIPFKGGIPAGEMHSLEGLPVSKLLRIPVSTLPVGVPGFVRWVKSAYPRAYSELNGRLANLAVTRMGLTDPSSVPDVAVSAADKPSLANTILSTVTELVKVGLPLYQQNKLFDLQLSRAKAGLAPLDTANIADMNSVKVGVDSATRNTGLMIAGAAILGLVGFKLLKSR